MTAHRFDVSGTGREEPKSPKLLVQKHFGRQSEGYTRSSLLSDQGSLGAVLDLAGVSGEDRVLDVATGTGFLAAALSLAAREVVATDLTSAMLEHARTRMRNQSNAMFALADTECLPFADDSFDVVSCRVAFHHFPSPQVALSEMARVCRLGGRVAIADVVSSENEARSEYHNQMERLCDASHVKAYRKSELEAMMEVVGFEVTKVKLWPFAWSFDEWMRVSGPDDGTAEKLRAMMLDSVEGDKSGLQVRLCEGSLLFTYTTAILVGRKILEHDS
jgi:ubiquinone/menaquinone biosynthesis C-methylase UbiE